MIENDSDEAPRHIKDIVTNIFRKYVSQLAVPLASLFTYYLYQLAEQNPSVSATVLVASAMGSLARVLPQYLFKIIKNSVWQIEKAIDAYDRMVVENENDAYEDYEKYDVYDDMFT